MAKSGSEQNTSESGPSSSNSNNEQNQNPTKESEASNPSSYVSPEEMSASNSPIVGLRGTENFGLAVFRDNKFVGILTAGETLCHSIITDEADSFVATVPNSDESAKPIVMDVYKNSNCKIKIDTSADHPIINLNISLSARLSSMIEGLNYTDSKALEHIKQMTEEHLKKEILDYLNKTAKEYKVDITGFYNIAKKNFLTQQDLDNYNWKEKYPNAEFNVDIDANVISSLLIQNF